MSSIVYGSNAVYCILCRKSPSLCRCDDIWLEQLFAMPDDEPIGRYEAQGGNVDQLVTEMRAIFERAKAIADERAAP